MAYWQREMYRSGVAMDQNQTWKEDLPKQGLLGSMLLKVGGQNQSGYGVGGGDWRLIDKLSKLSIIVNGSHDVKSLTGKQVQALAFYDQKKVSCDAWRNYATNTQWAWLLLNFGRKLYDKELGLDLSKFDRAEIWLENTASSTYFTDSLSVTIYCLWLREAGEGAFKGYLRSQEVYSKVPVAGAWDYIDLPTEGMLRRLLLNPIPGVDSDYLENTTWRNLMWDNRLMVKSRATEVMRCPVATLSEENWFGEEGEVLTHGYADVTADKGFDMGVGTPYGKAGIAGSKSGAVAGSPPTIEGDSQRFTEKSENRDASVPNHLFARGFGYHCTAVVPFDQDPNPETWMNLLAEKQVTLDIQCRSGVTVTSALNKVVTDRMINY
jgi:hypothetical protein